MNKLILFVLAASFLSGCHFLSEREHENVMKIPLNMHNLHKTDRELAKSDAELRKKTEKLEKEQKKLARADKRVVKKVESLDKEVKTLGREVKKMKETVDELKDGMHQQIEAQQVEIQQLSEHAVKLTLQDKLLFNKRSVQIKREGRRLLNKFVEAVKEAGSPVHIRIVGHTDDLPISKFQRTEFLDNWELSADRAAAVARYLIWAGHLDPSMMHIEGRADTQPLVPNTSEKNRAQNRRVELFLEHSFAQSSPMVREEGMANPCAGFGAGNPCAGGEPEVTPVM